MSLITFGILTVSDTCFEDNSKDASGPEAEKAIADFKGHVVCRNIVPDDQNTIMKKLIEWSDKDKVNVILTLGGTGFAEQDVTPEATRRVIDKGAHGLTCAMLNNSLQITPMSMLSRAICGIREKTLIINLPGSPRAVRENFDVIAKVIPHAVALILNDKAKIQKDHQSIQADKKMIDLSTKKKKLMTILNNIAHRPRKSQFPMISVQEATKMITDRVALNIMQTEEVLLENSHGRILATSIESGCDLPPFRASIKDGYAVIAEDGAGKRIVLESIAAGQEPGSIHLSSGQCVRINTGAPVPEGATAVVQIEDTELCTESLSAENNSEERTVRILNTPQEGQDIREIGSDIKKGMLIMKERTYIGAAQMGIMAACGVKKMFVYKKPTVGILSTGNELQEPGEEAKPGHVYDSNKITLIETLKENGYNPTNFGIVTDDAEAMIDRIEKALNNVDVLITTGSVSMGDKDILKPILTEVFGASIHFGRINMKPGKPTTFATCTYNGIKKYLLCLPGNPVSAMVTAHLFALPLLNGLSHSNLMPVIVKAYIAQDYQLDPRPEYARAVLEWENNSATPIATITGNQISSRLLSCKNANALVIFPGRTEGYTKVVGHSNQVTVMLLGFNKSSV